MKIALLLLALCTSAFAQNFTARKSSEHGIDIVHLADAERGMEVTIAPSFGNRAIAFRVHEKNILYFPFKDMSDFQKKPQLNGVPFLAPWANRLDEQAFWANGKQYRLNPALGNYRTDEHG